MSEGGRDGGTDDGEERTFEPGAGGVRGQLVTAVVRVLFRMGKYLA